MDKQHNMCEHRQCVRAAKEWTRNPLGPARRGSNPLAVDVISTFLALQPTFDVCIWTDSSSPDVLTWGYGATAAHLTPDQKVGSSRLIIRLLS
eukprot:4631754-Amphidinium_carterae.1